MNRTKFSKPDIFGVLSKDQFYTYIQYRPNGTPFYVGKGVNDRYCDDHSYNNHYMNVVYKYGTKNLKTVIFPVDNEKLAHQWERELIHLLRSEGYTLVNRTDGGEGLSGYRHTLETKTRQSLAAKKREEEKKANGWRHTPKAIALIAESSRLRKPYVRTSITIQKLSLNRKALVASGWEHPSKGRKGMFIHTEKARASMSKTRKGRKHSEPHRLALQQSQINRATRRAVIRIAFRVVSPMLLTA